MLLIFCAHFWISSLFVAEARSRNVFGYSEDEVVLALSEDTVALQNYAIGFWKPLPNVKKYEEMFFHVQVNSSLLKKLPVMKNLVGKLAQEADFLNLSPDHVGSDMKKLFVEENEVMANVSTKSSPLSAQKELMKFHLKSVFSRPRNAKLFPAAREEVGGFIFREMAKTGLLVKSEEFLFRKVTVDNSFEDSPSPPESGNNIVGLIPGKFFNTSQDRILVVGAHWDTFGLSPGVDDNGSGVAAMLEAARILASAPCYVPDFSVFFVAFDAEENGCRGSQDFIHSHLAPHLEATQASSLGAFILDTILNYDSSINSQKFSKAWREFGKSNIRSIEARGGRGDFVATVTRDDAKDENLRQTLAKYLALDGEKDFYHEAITVHSLNGSSLPSMEPIVDSSHFWMSDHSRFWYHLVAGLDMVNLGAVLISDTAYLRGHMEDCFHRECDTYDDLMEPEKSIEFLQFVTEALVKAVFELTMPGAQFMDACEATDVGLDLDSDANLLSLQGEGNKIAPDLGDQKDADIDIKTIEIEIHDAEKTDPLLNYKDLLKTQNDLEASSDGLENGLGLHESALKAHDNVLIDSDSHKYLYSGDDLSTVDLDVSNDLATGESHHIESLLEGPLKEVQVKNYQPNSAMQINIEHFNINNFLLHNKPYQAEDLLLLNDNQQNLARIVHKYFGYEPIKQSEQKIKNSPMVIAVDKYEL